jgi:hypothetical protein
MIEMSTQATTTKTEVTTTESESDSHCSLPRSARRSTGSPTISASQSSSTMLACAPFPLMQ